MEPNQTSSVTTILTVSGGFLAAVTAQIISHLYSQRRENQKYHKEIHQNLIAPVLIDLLVYFEARTIIKKEIYLDPTFKEDQLRERMINKISHNLKYVDWKVLTSFYNAERKKYFVEERVGDPKGRDEIELFIRFLDFTISINKHTKILSDSLLNETKLLRIRFAALITMINLGMKDEPMHWLLLFMFNKEHSVNKKTYRKFLKVNRSVGNKQKFKGFQREITMNIASFFGNRRTYGVDEALTELQNSLLDISKVTSDNPQQCQKKIFDQNCYE